MRASVFSFFPFFTVMPIKEAGPREQWTLLEYSYSTLNILKSKRKQEKPSWVALAMAEAPEADG